MGKNKGIKSEWLVTGICMGILLLFLLSIGLRVFTRLILVQKLGVENTFTHLVFWDNRAMATVNLAKVDWKGRYPFHEQEADRDGTQVKGIRKLNLVEKYTTIVKALETKVELYTDSFLAGRASLVQWHGNYDKLINWQGPFIDAKVNSQILYMENGYLTYVEPSVSVEDIEEIAGSVSDFSDYLAERGISFYYINAGSKVNPVHKELAPKYIKAEFTNENGDALLDALSEREVNVLDMRKHMIADGLDWYGSYYKTDHHWKTETGLWAAGVIAKMLNEKEGFDFDPSLFDEASYKMTTYGGCLFGAQGRSVSFAHADLEEYTCILPRFETDVSLEIPARGLKLSGSYQDTLYDYDNLEQVLQYSEAEHLQQRDAYNSVTWRNDAVGIIKNNRSTANEDKKILMLQDSFCYYSTTYLACGVGEIHMIHPAAFDGSVRAYVEEMQPDVVIAMFCEKNIKAIDWKSHRSMFDFR